MNFTLNHVVFNYFTKHTIESLYLKSLLKMVKAHVALKVNKLAADVEGKRDCFLSHCSMWQYATLLVVNYETHEIMIKVTTLYHHKMWLTAVKRQCGSTIYRISFVHERFHNARPEPIALYSRLAKSDNR